MDTQVTQRYSKVDLLSIKGRLGRRYYLFYSMLSLIVLCAVSALAGINHSGANLSSGSLLLLGLAIALVIFIQVALTIQRCHDFDKSGWYAIFALIPFSNLIYASIMSTNGLNRYGEMPEPAPIFIVLANYLLILLVCGSIALFYLSL